jgi:hypothetical protein
MKTKTARVMGILPIFIITITANTVKEVISVPKTDIGDISIIRTINGECHE